SITAMRQISNLLVRCREEAQYPLSGRQRSDRARDLLPGTLATQHSSRGLTTFAFQFRLGQRHVVYGTGEWIDDHLGREPVIVFVAEIGIGPADHPDDLLSNLVRHGLGKSTGFSCREAGRAERNHLLVRLVFLDRHRALGPVGDRNTFNLLALDVSMDGVIATLMNLMRSVGVHLVAEQLMRRLVPVRGECCSDERQHTGRRNGSGKAPASATHVFLLMSNGSGSSVLNGDHTASAAYLIRGGGTGSRRNRKAQSGFCD